MADFITAVKWMKEGNKIKLPTFTDSDTGYWYMKDDEIHVAIEDEDKKITHIPISYFNAKDWEIFEDKDV